MKYILILLTLITTSAFGREYVPSFTPSYVTVADGYLQIGMPNSHEIEGCAASYAIVLKDTDPYFDAYLSLAMTAFVSGKKLNVAIGAPCEASPRWPTVHVVKLHN